MTHKTMRIGGRLVEVQIGDQCGLQKGDLVEAVSPYKLACGSGVYGHAVVVHLNPVVLVSPGGDMLWCATLYKGCIRAVARALPATLSMAMERWEKSRDHHHIDDPDEFAIPTWSRMRNEFF